MNKTKHFINLTNGIEALEKYQIPADEVNFIRIQSCYVERHLFNDILLEIDHNFLMYAALGYECNVYDFGAQCDISKATYMGVAWIKYVLERRWLGLQPKLIVKDKDISNYVDELYCKIPNRLKTRLDYYKKYLNTSELRINIITSATLNDNNIDYYKETLWKKLKVES
jgi:hypothetical protein